MIHPSGKKILVTSALPYANGPIHMGHLVEYIQTDIAVRYLRLKGEDVIYCCADDTHGAPIEITASKLGIRPEEMIAQYHKEHLEDFTRFQIRFDSFYSTNAPENKKQSDWVFTQLRDGGHIEEREVDLTYCDRCNRFLPDRYVRGLCPKCGAKDQYGDACEKCNATYEPVDLVQATCAICGQAPGRKKSVHFFFKLGHFGDRLREWLEGNAFLQAEVKNYLYRWMDEGLRDWDITRDPPYFGFNILDIPDKYYYVWLDAPIGYISSCEHYCSQHGRHMEEYWKNPEARIIHFIGKDIIYFHFLFWPAMLMASGLSLPENIVVHGHLTLHDEKMSKSRGTQITAKHYLERSDPTYLRFYYASNLTRTLGDLNFDEKDFTSRVNSDLIGNFANLANRTLTFVKRNFGGRVGPVDPLAPWPAFYERVQSACQAFEEFQLRQAVKQIMEAGDLFNKYFQDQAPWKKMTEDREAAWGVLGACTRAIRDLCILMSPITPALCEKLEGQLNMKDLRLQDLETDLGEHTLGEPSPLIPKIEGFTLRDPEPVARLDLRTGLVIEVAEHPSAEKLYVMQVDTGDRTRQIVAGLRAFYGPHELQGQRVVILCNLKPAKLRGALSEGMILAADDGKDVGLLLASGPPGSVVRPENGHPTPAPQITIEEFAEVGLVATEKGVFVGTSRLVSDHGPIAVARSVVGKVR